MKQEVVLFSGGSCCRLLSI